jgi:hypothetical protein
MQSQPLATDDIVARYFELFVNRRAYTVQSSAPDSEKGRCYYYRPKGRVSLSEATLRNHLEGRLTIGLYAINPSTQRCKWVAIDADYSNALEDLLKLQWELRQDGVEAALEKSRRGGHLWIFADQPLLARDCRVYIHSLARRLKVPVKGVMFPDSSSGRKALADGIEVFPKQDEIPVTEFGNAIRGPLGTHRGVGKRFWFYGADYTLEAQVDYLTRLRRITAEEMSRFVSRLKFCDEARVSRRPIATHYVPRAYPGRREFSILEHVTGKKRRTGRNYFTRCPSCAREGRDETGDNLAISIADPRKYKCWAGCTKEDIRAALGCPIRTRHGLSA